MRTPVGPPSGDRWMGNYKVDNADYGWQFDLARAGNWSGTGIRTDDPQRNKHGCHAFEKQEAAN